MKKILFITTCSFSLLLISLYPNILVSKVNAQARTITVIPPTASYTANPGDTIEGTVKIRNDASGDEGLSFSTQVQDFIVEDSHGTPRMLQNPNILNNRYSLASWISPRLELRSTLPIFTLAPHQTYVLNYTIVVPTDARPGGHYAALLFSPTNPIQINNSSANASVVGNIASLVLVTVAGDLREEARITKFFTHSFQEYGPVTVAAQIQNLGDTHLRPTGTITISDTLGNIPDEYSLPAFNIFPQATRDYEATLGDKFMFGRIKVDLFVSYGNNKQLHAVSYLWIIPWQLATLTVLVFITLILAAMLWRKRLYNRRLMVEDRK